MAEAIVEAAATAANLSHRQWWVNTRPVKNDPKVRWG